MPCKHQPLCNLQTYMSIHISAVVRSNFITGCFFKSLVAPALTWLAYLRSATMFLSSNISLLLLYFSICLISSSACSRSAVPNRTLQQGTTLTFAAKGTRAVATKAVVFLKSSICLSNGSLAREWITPSGMYSPCRRAKQIHARPGGWAGTNQTEPRFLRGTTASSHAELYVISNKFCLLTLCCTKPDTTTRHDTHFCCEGHQSSSHEGSRFLEKFDLPLERFARSRVDHSFGHVQPLPPNNQNQTTNRTEAAVSVTW